MSTLLVILLVWALGIPALVLATALALPRIVSVRRRRTQGATAEVTHLFPAQRRPQTVVPLRARGHR